MSSYHSIILITYEDKSSPVHLYGVLKRHTDPPAVRLIPRTHTLQHADALLLLLYRISCNSPTKLLALSLLRYSFACPGIAQLLYNITLKPYKINVHFTYIIAVTEQHNEFFVKSTISTTTIFHQYIFGIGTICRTKSV